MWCCDSVTSLAWQCRAERGPWKTDDVFVLLCVYERVLAVRGTTRVNTAVMRDCPGSQWVVPGRGGAGCVTLSCWTKLAAGPTPNQASLLF